MTPKVFIGSSSERLDEAEAIQYNLTQHNLSPPIKCELWNQGIFPLSFSILESFVKILNDCDFGIFVFAPDDKLQIRTEGYNAVRDNVLFELGLFIGHLGRERCFLVIPQNRTDFRLPTDLWGITTVYYDHGSDNLLAALGPACTRMKAAIKNTPPINLIHVYQERIARAIEDETARMHLENISSFHNELAKNTKFSTDGNQMLSAFVTYPMTRYADALIDLHHNRSFRLRSYPRMHVAMEAIKCSNQRVRAISIVRNDPWQYAGEDSLFVEVNIESALKGLEIERLYIVEDEEDIERNMPVVKKKAAAGISLKYGIRKQMEDTFAQMFRLDNLLICDETVLSHSLPEPDHDGYLVYNKTRIADSIREFNVIWRTGKNFEI